MSVLGLPRPWPANNKTQVRHSARYALRLRGYASNRQRTQLYQGGVAKADTRRTGRPARCMTWAPWTCAVHLKSLFSWTLLYHLKQTGCQQVGACMQNSACMKLPAVTKQLHPAHYLQSCKCCLEASGKTSWHSNAALLTSSAAEHTMNKEICVRHHTDHSNALSSTLTWPKGAEQHPASALMLLHLSCTLPISAPICAAQGVRDWQIHHRTAQNLFLGIAYL